MEYFTLKIKITDKCNRKCEFCVFNNNSRDMTLDELKRVVEIVKDVRFSKLHINGGEPLVHKNFLEITEYTKKRFPDKTFVLGTNAVLLDGNENLLTFVRDNYKEICIGCDDEHKNIDVLERVIPILKQREDIVVVVNSLIEYTSEDTFERINALKNKYGIIAVCNNVYHTKKGAPVNNLRKGLCKKQNSVIMIQENGDFYRCFNCCIPDDKEGSVYDPNFLSYIEQPRKTHFSVCPWCKCYE